MRSIALAVIATSKKAFLLWMLDLASLPSLRYAHPTPPPMHTKSILHSQFGFHCA